MNGQHRLLAVAISGVPTVLLIARNVPIKAQKGYDQGLARGAADWLSHRFQSIPKKEVTSPILRNIMLLAAGGVGNQYGPYTAEAIAEMYEKDLAWLGRVLEKDRKVNDVPLFKNSSVRTGLVIAHQFEPKSTHELVEAILDGTNLRPNTPARVLKEWLSNLPMNRNKLNSLQKTCGVLRAIQAYIMKETLPKSIPRTGAEVVEGFVANRRDLIPAGTFLPEFGKKGGDPASRNRSGADPRA